MIPYLIFNLWLALSVFLAGFDAGLVPMRTIVLFVLVLWSLYRFIFLPRQDKRCFSRSNYILLSIFLVGVAVVLQLANHQPWPTFLVFLLRYLLQPLLLAIVLIALMLKYGLRRVLIPFIIVACLSSVVAIMQMAGVELAWTLRKALGGFQAEGGAAYFYLHQDRPMGLSLNPVHLGYQCLVALVCACYLKKVSLLSDMAMLFVPSLLMTGIIATGLRSAFLGAIVFLAVALFLLPLGKMLKAGVVAIALGLCVVRLITYLDDYQEEQRTRLRVVDFNTATSSRMALNAYSLRLFLDHPLGFGLGFDTRVEARNYQGELRRMKSSEALKTLAPHNAIAVFGIIYGVFGLLALGGYLVLVGRKNAILGVGLAAYLLNSVFHNSGLFVGDHFALFILIAAELAVRARGISGESPADDRVVA